MRARIAYISSLGTTAILVAAALLMLAVVGALVAFRGWPGNANGAVIQRVPLGPGSGAARTVLVRPTAATTSKRVVRVESFATRAAARARLSTAGLVKQPASPAAPGIVMQPVAPPTMPPASPQTTPATPPPAVQNAVAQPDQPTSTAPAPVGGGSSPLPYVPLPGPLAQGSPGAPTDQVVGMVGELIGTPPPPVVGTVVDSRR